MDEEEVFSRVEEALSTGALGDLVGLPEGARFEAKGEVYDLGSASDRYELAKDVSALANASGGFLLLGPVTERAEDRDLDIVCALNPIEEDESYLGALGGVIREYVYPDLDGLTVQYAEGSEEEGGLISIEVPDQHLDAGPFLICRVVEEDEHLKQIIAGYVRRIGSDNLPLSPKELHHRFRKGSDTVSLRLGRMEEKLDLLVDRSKETEPEPGAGVDQDELAGRISDVLGDTE